MSRAKQPRMLIRLLLLALVLAGCGDTIVGGDLASGDLASTSPDLAVASDLAVAVDSATPVDLDSPCADPSDGGVWSELRCTGLYSDWATRTVDPANREFVPSYRLWSDGAQKRRWIYLPPGTKIDVTDLNAWTFPIGTKLWKEFSLDVGGTRTRIETRLLWKRDTSWVMTTYAWSADQSTAVELPGGMVDVPGTNHYEIPSANSGGCTVCHNGRPDRVLGFEAISLAEATPLSWTDLQTATLVTSTNGNHTVAGSALLVPGNATEKPAIGYLHANCGNACHHPGGTGPFSMRVDITSGAAPAAPANVQSTAVFSAINTHSGFTPSGGTGNYYRIRPTDVSRSTIPFRMNTRGGYPQMPPVDTHVVDSAGLAAVSAWITAMTAAPYPAPAAP